MSRIQHILDKAERDGAVQRMRVVIDAPPSLPDATLSPPADPAVADPGRADPAVANPRVADAVAAGRIVADTPPADPAARRSPAPGATAPAGRSIGSVRLDRRLVATGAAKGAAAEQYRALRTRILHGDTGVPVNVVLVTSPSNGDGKTLTAANLGLTMAQEFQRRVCVVDANMRQPQLHRLFGLPDSPGLSDVLLGRSTIAEACVSLEEHRITLLTAGPVPIYPAELLGSIIMRRTLEQLRVRFDAVIVDAPAALPLADVGILTPIVDSVVVVVRAGITPKPAIHDTMSALDPGKVLGIVLNDAT
jgi:capsular exopolysaccharide synthesis family protein